MKRALYSIAIIIIGLLWGYIYMSRVTPLVKQPVHDLVLPSDIRYVHHGVFDAVSETLFLAVRHTDDTCGVWSYKDQVFDEHLRIASSTCFSAHIFVAPDQELYLSMNAPAQLYRSTDGGMTWNVVLEKVDVFWAMAAQDDIRYGTLWSRDVPAIYKSNDAGLSWHQWVDFHDIVPSSTDKYDDDSDLPRMRHLHDIAILNDDMFVGTGDVMREALHSSDHGETWDSVWGEGFTAHIVDDHRLILGADIINRYGIAVYDAETGETRDVWVPDHSPWQGYIYSMLKKNGVYYAATHLENNSTVSSYGILYSRDGIDWQVWHEYKSDWVTTQLYILDGPEKQVYVIDSGRLSFIQT